MSKEDRERVAKAMKDKKGFSIEIEPKCAKCGAQYLWVELYIKIPEIVSICKSCLPKDANMKERVSPESEE